MHMVVASFLQKHHQFVSMAFGGYQALHRLIVTNSDYERYLIDHNKKQCIVCTQTNNKLINNSSPRRKGMGSPSHSVSSEVEHFTSALLDKMASAVKPKMKEMKDKLVDYVTNPNQQQVVRHVSPTDKLGKRYKASNRFTIDEDLESGKCCEYISIADDRSSALQAVSQSELYSSQGLHRKTLNLYIN